MGRTWRPGGQRRQAEPGAAEEEAEELRPAPAPETADEKAAGEAKAAAVLEQCMQRSKILLGPFLERTWRSEALGPLRFEGDPGRGHLRVLHDTDEGVAQRCLRVDEKNMVLEGEASLRISKDESHARRRAVWRGERDLCEVWVVQGGGATASSSSRAAPAPAPDARRALEEGNRASKEERHREAVEWYSRALEQAGPNDRALRLEALCSRARAHALQPAPAAALADAEEAVALAPESRRSHEALGLAKYVSGDYAAARDAYQTGLQKEPGCQSCWDGLQCSLRELLQGRTLPELKRTFDIRGSPVRSVWDSCLPQGAPANARAGWRQFAMTFDSTVYPQIQVPYLLTLPAELGNQERKYPLVLYLHSAGSSDIVSGDFVPRQLTFTAQESPLTVMLERGQPGPADAFIGISPCCPSNLGQLDAHAHKSMKKRKVFWFKVCEAGAYQQWDFSQAKRCFEMEVAVTELLAHVCEQLPVDASRIYFVGSSGGGYAVLRLGEVLPELPAVIVPMAGYYPDMPGEDHDAAVMADRLRATRLWPMHCALDKLCRIDHPHVERAYRLLHERNGVVVEWVPEKLAKGSGSNYHSAYQRIFDNPDHFFRQLSGCSLPRPADAVGYLQRRLRELTQPGLAAKPARDRDLAGGQEEVEV